MRDRLPLPAPQLLPLRPPAGPEIALLAGKVRALKDGVCWLFIAIEQGVVGNLDPYSGTIAAGLKLRVDWGTQHPSHNFEAETRRLGTKISHSFVGDPQCNGIAERFIRTAKEECLWLLDFEDLEQARKEIAAPSTVTTTTGSSSARIPDTRQAHEELLQEAA